MRNSTRLASHTLLVTLTLAVHACCGRPAVSEIKTWDGRHSIDAIEVTLVYFVPKDRKPLRDWRDRLDYYAKRIVQFHDREFDGQSKLAAVVHKEPVVSTRETKDLREGDANSIFFKTLREVDQKLSFASKPNKSFPILLVMSEINWRPLDDFYRLKPTENGPAFEGQLIRGLHHPGAASGGARATYLARPRKGWGLVSADGWRVPYRGSDCVAYHEGVGHTVGLPHPPRGNGSVMSLGQYRGWINESWLNVDQKRRLGWEGPDEEPKEDNLFSRFTVTPEPRIPKPGETVVLRTSWPTDSQVKSIRVRRQTQIDMDWTDIPVKIMDAKPPETITLGEFDTPTPISFRIDVELKSGESAELWGYLQVRAEAGKPPIPKEPTVELR